MSEEEKETIEYLRKYTQWETHGEKSLETDILTLLNLIQKQDKIIDKMAEEILKIDTAKSKFEYDHAKVWDTEKGIKEYFKKVVDEDE